MSNHNAARKAHRRPSFTFHAPARQENTKSGSLFVFGDSTAVEVESSDYEGIEMPIIHRRGTKPTTPDLGDQKSKFVFIHRDLAPTDTLASISLQYGCPVAELKRANNIYSEQDFHGRVQLRIPVPIHSLMTDPEEQARMQPTTRLKDMVNGDSSEAELFNGTEDSVDDFSNAVPHSDPAARKSALRAEKFLRQVDNTLLQVKQQIHDEDGILHDEQSQFLSRVAPNPEATHLVHSSQSTASKEMDYARLCGLTWKQLVFLSTIGLVLGSVLLFFYWHKLNGDSEDTPTTPGFSSLR